MIRNLFLFSLIFFSIFNFIGATGDDQTLVLCGGDEELQIMCDFGDAENYLKGYQEIRGGKIIEDKEFMFKLSIIILLFIILLLIILFICYKLITIEKRKKSK